MVFVWIHYELLEISIFNQQILIQKSPIRREASINGASKLSSRSIYAFFFKSSFPLRGKIVVRGVSARKQGHVCVVQIVH